MTAAGAVPLATRASASQLPNIIFLMTDQQRWDAIGLLNPQIRTPNLDGLAKDGILYRQATCQAPMCVPSRNSMMFGLYPSQLGIRSNGSHSLGDRFLPHDPLPEQLRRAGYQTAGFGKTHWGRMDEVPSTRGFEVRVVGAKEIGQERGARYQDDEDPQGLANYRREVADYGGGEEGVPGYIGCTSRVPEREHRDGWTAAQCLRFLDSGVDPKRPLFLYLSFLKPHAGLNVPKRFEDLYRLEDMPATPQPPWQEESGHLAYTDRNNKMHATRYKQWREAFSKMPAAERKRTTLRYYANCSWLESYFGEVLQRLEKMRRLENALIVYTSDHGEMLGERNFRFTKYCLYESSVRVPVILSGSAVPQARRGTIDDRPVELLDLLPTISRVAGITAPAGLPGVDLLGGDRHLASFCEFHDSGAPAYMWRKKDWKLILYLARPLREALMNPGDSGGELYDLERDPHEWNNLYGRSDHAETRERMKSELLGHLACAAAQYPMGRG